jgi:ABC-type transport system involved in cytochrome c biogenesis permease component
MTFLPIADRELRLAARKPDIYRIRCGAALLVSSICLVMILANPGASPVRLGPAMFHILKWSAFIYCLLVGVRYTADCLSEEKRNGTLGLLFLTDLRAYDVVVGKMVVSSAHAFYGLLAAFPLFSLPLLFGGVTPGEFWRMLLVLLNTAFFSLALGALISSLGRDVRQVAVITFAALLTFTAGFFFIWNLVNNVFSSRWFDWIFLWPNPAHALLSSSFIGTPGARFEFWTVLAIQFGLGFLWIGLACIFLPRGFQEKGLPFSGAIPRRRPRSKTSSAARRNMATLRQEHPFQWLVTRRQLFPPWLLAGVILFFAAWLAWAFVREPPGFRFFVVFGSYAIHMLVKILITADASHRLSEDRRSGALELLLCTPLQVEAMLRGQYAALRQTFLLPALALVTLNLVLMYHIQESEVRWVLLGSTALIAADFHALSWVGMWQAMKSSRYSRAVWGASLRVLIPPCSALLIMFFAGMTGGLQSGTIENFFRLWFFGCFIYDALWARVARTRLHRDFRSLAASIPELKEPGKTPRPARA